MVCNVCGVVNIAKQVLFNDQTIQDYIKDILEGNVTPEKLSEQIHETTAEALANGVEIGYGIKLDALPEDSSDYRLLDELISSCYIFAAHKQHSFVVHLLDELDGQEDELQYGIDLFKRYFIDYLTTEIDSAEWQSRGAKTFKEQIDWDNGKEVS